MEIMSGRKAQEPITEERLTAMLKLQLIHPCMPTLVVRWKTGPEGRYYEVRPFGRAPDTGVRMSMEDIVRALAEREMRIKMAEIDRHNYGWVFPGWHENLWEICRLRVRNPGESVSFLVSGGNGSAKSEFAGWVTSRIMTQIPRKPLFFLTDDEPKSKDVQQQKVYVWLPEKYHNERGRQSTNANTKFGWNGAGGFTENEFC